jgi:hypothetical protein
MPGIDSILYELGSEWRPAVDIVREHGDQAPPGADVDEWAEEFCRERGLVEVCVEPERPVYEVAKGLMEQFFQTASVRPQDIDLFIYGGSAEFGEPGTRPFRLAHELGLPQRAELFWHFIGCATGVSAAKLALDHLEKTGGKHALILQPCHFHDTHDNPRVLVSTVCGDGIMLQHVTTGPARWEILSQHVSSRPDFYAFGLTPDGTIDPLEVIKHGVGHVKAHVGEEVKDLKGVYLVYNGFAVWNRFARALGIPVERLDLETLARGGHIDSLDPLRGMVDHTADMEPGSRVLMYAQSLGLAFNTTLIEVTANNGH